MHNTNTVDHLFGKGRTVMDSEGRSRFRYLGFSVFTGSGIAVSITIRLSVAAVAGATLRRVGVPVCTGSGFPVSR